MFCCWHPGRCCRCHPAADCRVSACSSITPVTCNASREPLSLERVRERHYGGSTSTPYRITTTYHDNTSIRPLSLPSLCYPKAQHDTYYAPLRATPSRVEYCRNSLKTERVAFCITTNTILAGVWAPVGVGRGAWAASTDPRPGTPPS
jgi:hypothetical protein